MISVIDSFWFIKSIIMLNKKIKHKKEKSSVIRIVASHSVQIDAITYIKYSLQLFDRFLSHLQSLDLLY